LTATIRTVALVSTAAMSFAVSATGNAQGDAPPTVADWAALADLPDWGGIWIPDIADQRAQERANSAPWTPEAAAIIDDMITRQAAGRPAGIFNDCLPEGMPTWMMISHNAMEILFTPGRITMLGESDGNRLRRIYTDGRQHPEDPDLTYHGHSIGRWDDDTLIVDTVGILPEAYIAISEATGVRNGGDMHIVERIYLVDDDTLHVDLEITAPHVLTETWRTTRIYERLRGPYAEIIEGVCLQGSFVDQLDSDGSAIFVPELPQ
jgi:hypothetical protein